MFFIFLLTKHLKNNNNNTDSLENLIQYCYSVKDGQKIFYINNYSI